MAQALQYLALSVKEPRMQMIRKVNETSIAFSLSELERLEEERQREEERERTRVREEQARQRRQAEAARRHAEEVRALAQVEARQARDREEAEAKAAAEGRAQAELLVASIEAEAKAQLEADNARRAHELESLRIRTQDGHGRTQLILGSALGLVCVLAAFGIYGIASQNVRLEEELTTISEEMAATLSHSSTAHTHHLQTLDSRLETLRARPLAGELSSKFKEIERIRRAVEKAPRSWAANGAAAELGPGRLPDFARALEELEQTLSTLERRSALDQRWADLQAASMQLKRVRRGAAYAAAERLHTNRATNPQGLAVYERALDRLRESLGPSKLAVRGPSRGPGKQVGATTVSATTRCAGDGDPLCGIDGRAL